MPQVSRLEVIAYESLFTIGRPLLTLYRNPKISGIITGIVLSAIITLALCAHYVKTNPMIAFNHYVSQISHFLNNPIHAGLVGGIAGIVYLLVARELINKSKLRYGWENDDPCGARLTGQKEPCVHQHHSPIYVARRQENRETPPVLSKGRKACILTATTIATVTSPIIIPIYKNPKITAITFIAIITLILCAHYVHTKTMQDFNNAMSKVYHNTMAFLKNPTYAALVSTIGGIAYIAIGRELVHGNKIDLLWNPHNSHLSVLWGFGNRKKLLRQLENNAQYLYTHDFERYKSWDNYEKYCQKVQNDGDFYIVDNLKDTWGAPCNLILLNTNGVIKCYTTYDSVSDACRLATLCGYSQVHEIP